MINMANWGNAKNVTVVSHEYVEDTNPDTYIERGLKLFEDKRYAEAENEYLKAVRFSGTDDKYTVELLRFYYASGHKDFRQKANQLYREWYHKQKEYKTYKTFFMVCLVLSVIAVCLAMFCDPTLCAIVLPLAFIGTILAIPKSLFVLDAKCKMSNKIPGPNERWYSSHLRFVLQVGYLALYTAITVVCVVIGLLFVSIGAP